MGYTSIQDRAALVQREMAQSVAELRPAKARTLATFEQGTRTKQGSMIGYQIPFWRDYAHGSGTNSPLEGDNSFARSNRERSGAMFAGIVYRYMNIWLHADILRDMENGKIPDSYIKERRRRIATYQMKKNWAAIGDGTGAIAHILSAAGTTLTLAATNAARGTSKGSFRLAVSDISDPLYYSAYNTTTNAEVARFFVTAKNSLTTAEVDFTGGVGNIAALNVAGLKVVEYRTGWMKEIIGIGGHISDQSRIYQGADTSLDSFLKNVGVDGGAAAPTPTLIDSMKNINMTRGEDMGGRDGFIAHITPGNWSVLAIFGYGGRVYNAEGGKAQTTFGLPDTYKDGDTTFVPDAHYEDAYIDLRRKAPYFEYVQKEFGKKSVDGVSRHEWVGASQAGSREEYENYTENTNIVWDSQGKDADMEGGGSPNDAVFAYNLALPTIKQATYGLN